MPKKTESKTTDTISGAVDGADLLRALKLMAKHVERSSFPILNCVLLRFSPDGGMLSASHPGIDLVMTATFAGEGSGVVAVPIKPLVAFLDGAGPGRLTMAKGAEDSAVVFTSGDWRSSIIAHPVADAPELKLPTAPVRSFGMAEGVFRHLFGFAARFASTEETRYYLNGVALEFRDNEVQAVATNGHSLGTRTVKTPAKLEAWNKVPIFPNDLVSAVSDIIGDSQCFAHVYPRAKDNDDPGYALFTREGWTITGKLIDGTFPDWRRATSSAGEPSEVLVPVAPFVKLRNMARGSRGPGSAMNGARISQAPGGGLTVAITSPETDLSGKVDAEPSKPFDPVGLNIFYIANIAKAFGAPRLLLKIRTPVEPIFVVDPNGAATDFAVMMPMRVA